MQILDQPSIKLSLLFFQMNFYFLEPELTLPFWYEHTSPEIKMKLLWDLVFSEIQLCSSDFTAKS